MREGVPIPRIDQLMDAAGLLIAAKDGEGRYAYANERFLRAFAIEGPLVAWRWRDEDIFPPDVARHLRNNDATLPFPEEFSEESLPFPDGLRTFMSWRATTRGEEGGMLLVWAAVEITKRVRADHELLAAREFFESILNIAADAIISLDERQRIILYNQGAQSIFQYAPEEVVGQPLDVLLPTDARDEHRHHVGMFGRHGVPARQMGQRGRIRGRRKDGTVFPAEASILRTRVAGRPYFTAILRDVTEAREAEEVIKSLNANLSERATQLEAANRELEAFSYSVSHDLRAPLRSIDGFSQVLLSKYAPQLDAEGRGYLERVRAASQRMARLIDDILGLARVSREGVHRERLDLTAIVRTAASDLRARDANRQVEFIIAPGLTAEADPRLILVALSNLLGNAWKYSRSRRPAVIEFGAFDGDDGREVFYVRDNGVGFDMTYADKLFGAFQRLHSVEEFPGTGIGLATVQRIVHKHGGRIWAEAEPQKGATFYFTLA